MEPYLTELRGVRRALLTLAILFFVIMLLEVDLGHRPALASGEAWLALVPVVWLPIALVALMAVQIAPSHVHDAGGAAGDGRRRRRRHDRLRPAHDGRRRRLRTSQPPVLERGLGRTGVAELAGGDHASPPCSASSPRSAPHRDGETLPAISSTVQPPASPTS